MKAGMMAVENGIVVDLEAISNLDEIQAAVVRPQLKREGKQHGLLLNFAKNHSNPIASSLLEAVPAFQPSSCGTNGRLFPERATDSNWRAHWAARGGFRVRGADPAQSIGKRQAVRRSSQPLQSGLYSHIMAVSVRRLRRLAYNKAICLGCARRIRPAAPSTLEARGMFAAHVGDAVKSSGSTVELAVGANQSKLWDFDRGDKEDAGKFSEATVYTGVRMLERFSRSPIESHGRGCFSQRSLAPYVFGKSAVRAKSQCLNRDRETRETTDR